MTQPDVPSELECSVCLQLLHEPASLPCGHSFCLSCVRRSLSSNRSCPLCRRACYGAVQTNLALTHALRMLYPNVEPRRRSTSHADVAVDSLVLPCFLSSAVEFPGNHVRLHLFETRYRILSQRALEGGGEFAICFAAQGRGFPMMAPPQSLVGTTTTVFLIEHSRSTPDGRFFLVARGQRRARVVETWVDHEAGDLYVVRLQPIVESDNNMPNHIDVSLNGLSDEQLADHVLLQMRTMGFGDVGGRPEEDGGVVGVDSPPARRALSWRAARGLHLHDGAAQHRLLAAATTRERLEHLTRLYDAALRRQKHQRRWSFCFWFVALPIMTLGMFALSPNAVAFATRNARDDSTVWTTPPPTPGDDMPDWLRLPLQDMGIYWTRETGIRVDLSALSWSWLRWS